MAPIMAPMAPQAPQAPRPGSLRRLMKQAPPMNKVERSSRLLRLAADLLFQRL